MVFSGYSGFLHTKINTINQTINFAIINCQHLNSNISTAPSCGVYISQLIRYARYCSLYLEFLQHHRLLSTIFIKARILKESSHFFFFRTISTPCGEVFCHLHTDDNRWYWQFDYGSRLTIISLLCPPMVLCTIWSIIDGYGHWISFIEPILCIWQLLCQYYA